MCWLRLVIEDIVNHTGHVGDVRSAVVVRIIVGTLGHRCAWAGNDAVDKHGKVCGINQSVLVDVAEQLLLADGPLTVEESDFLVQRREVVSVEIVFGKA